MAAPQLAVIALLLVWDKPLHAMAVAALLFIQLGLMSHFLASVSKRALWYSGFGIPFFVSGMMISAFAVRSLV